MKKDFDGTKFMKSLETCDEEIRTCLETMTTEHPLWRYREYLSRVLEEPRLSPKEEQALVLEGSEEAQEKLVSSMLRYPVAATLRCEGSGMLPEDLINEGNLMVTEAVARCIQMQEENCSEYVIQCLQQKMYSMIKNHLRRRKAISFLGRGEVMDRIRKSLQEQKQAAEAAARQIGSVRPGEVVFLNLREDGKKMDFSCMGRVWEQGVQLLPACYLSYQSEPAVGGADLRTFWEEVFIVPDAEDLDATESGQRWLAEMIESVRADKGFVFAGVEISDVLGDLQSRLDGMVREVYL